MAETPTRMHHTVDDAERAAGDLATPGPRGDRADF
jgi:hypothetical protein